MSSGDKTNEDVNKGEDDLKSPNVTSSLLNKNGRQFDLNDKQNQNSNSSEERHNVNFVNNGIQHSMNHALSNFTDDELRMAHQYNSVHYQGYGNMTSVAHPPANGYLTTDIIREKLNYSATNKASIETHSEGMYLNENRQYHVKIHGIDPQQEQQPLHPSYQNPALDPNQSLEDQHYSASTWGEQPGEFYSSVKSTPQCSVLDCFTSCFSSLAAVNLQRSFCFGAIDGLLTGSSITFAASGLGLFSPSSPITQRLLLIALTFAACSADGFCMALGHVWSTFVVNENMAKEKQEEMVKFQNRRAEAKARLVDLLLMRGMLKIDAMSIADTLEGYPDIFLGALTGDMMAQSTTTFQQSLPSNEIGISSQYDAYLAEDDMDYHDHKADAESRSEGVFMMLSFSLFSVLPPLIFSFVPNMINPNVQTHHVTAYYDPYGGKYGYDDSQDLNSGVSPTSVTVSILSCIMLFLGIWKSKFYDSNWIIFGIETILVLVFCNLSAFFIGTALRSTITTDEDFTIISSPKR